MKRPTIWLTDLQVAAPDPKVKSVEIEWTKVTEGEATEGR